ncbi:MAG TPA: STAUR_1299 family protein, partial [Thermodesulfobacteriota bacterium]|nr:STAUR_1299 family protein [Thermodesulfobacteriota bacterium]
MDPFRDLLFSKAFQVVPGSRYNQVSQDLRETWGILFYEVVLREDTPWEHLRDQIYPVLARYLRYKSISPELPKGVVVSLFFHDRFYLLQASDFLLAYQEKEELDPDAFHARVLEWLAKP